MKKLIPNKSQDNPTLSADLSTELSIYTFARTIYGEARGEGPAGMRAVAAVVMNRVRAPGWWGGDIESVCRKPMQFSCWNENDFNRPIIEAADENDPVFTTALRIARRAAACVLDDPTGGANHYHAAGIHPRWARGQKPTATIGRHIFYRL